MLCRVKDMADSFSERLRAEASPIWHQIYANPFLAELKAGTLPLEKFRYYMTQDYLYLEGFARTVALALAKAPDTHNLELLSHRVSTPVERPLHQKMMGLVGLTPEEAEAIGRSPTCMGYVNHMLATASLKGLGPTAAALLPCPWTYHELGDMLGELEHPVYSQWSAPYIEGLLADSVAAWRSFVDECAKTAGAVELEQMRTAFMVSSRYEWLFWHMAYNMEAWPPI